MSEIKEGWFCPKNAAPQSFTPENFSKFLFDMREAGDFDDIFFQDSKRVMVKSQGKLLRCTDRKLSASEMAVIANYLARGSNGAANIMKGEPLSTAYDVIGTSLYTGEKAMHRFRVQGSAGRKKTGQGIGLVLRKIESEPKHIGDMHLDNDLIKAIIPPNGLVVVAGETGSGKSTLLSSIIRHILETRNNLTINTGEAPVETSYHNVKTDCIITQVDIPRDIKDFTLFLENCLRTNPDICLVGECKTEEISRKVIELAQTGHLTYTTLHADSIESVIRRLTKAFGKNQETGLFDVLSSLRVVIIQKLISKKGGGRVPCRSILVIDDYVREKLINTNNETLISDVKKLVEEKGVRMHQYAEMLFRQDLIDESTFQWIKAGA